jgi:hypothetical protein
MKKIILFFSFAVVFVGCATVTPPPQWNATTEVSEAEYDPYVKTGTGTITGQAFLTQRDGGVVKAAGRNVTLDPATSVGKEWWGKAGKVWVHRSLTPPSPNFHKARKLTIADADGRFKFTDLPAGKYFVRTAVTWEIGGYYPTQGGLVGKLVEVRDGEVTEVILNKYAK